MINASPSGASGSGGASASSSSGHVVAPPVGLLQPPVGEADPDGAAIAMIDDSPEELLERTPQETIEELADCYVPADEPCSDEEPAASGSDDEPTIVEKPSEPDSGAPRPADPVPAPPPPVVPPPVPEFCPLGSDISDPSALHYMYRNGRSVLRLQPMPSRSSQSVKCYIHTGSICSLLIANHHMPSMADLKAWLAGGTPYSPGDTKAVKEAKATQHLNELKALRDSKKALG